nr:serine hydrolase domain-containing protein [Pusillimonas sp. MFBS29]
MPGCAWEVHRGDQVLLQGAYGVRRVGAPAPITVDTAFDIASVSKQFTALSIVQLAAQGRLSLDDPVRRHLPELPAYFDRILVRHMIWHTGGVPDYIRPLFKAGRQTARVSSQEALQIIINTDKPVFEPGTRYKYSNSGYFLLAQIVERVSGQSMAAYAQAHIFGPLGMRDTRYVDHYPNPVGRRANGHRTLPDGTVQVVEIEWEPTGDGQVFTTLKDLRRWMQVLAHGHPAMDPRVLAMIKQPGRLDDGQAQAYGYGLQHVKVGGHDVLMHEGGWSGTISRFVWSPQGFGGIILCNYYEADVERLLDPLLLSLVGDKP